LHAAPSNSKTATDLTTNSSFCNFRTFARGYLDWLNERMYGPAPGAQPVGPKDRTGSVFWLLLIIPGGIIVVALLFPLFAPALVAGMGAAGTTAVMNASIGLSVVSSLAFVIGIPVLWARRFYRFSRHCCLRGRELAAGTRARARVR
jgi:hypothetical protein